MKKIKAISLLLAICLGLLGFTYAHPLKMSFSKLTITKTGEAQLTSKLFLDDLTEHFQNRYRLQKVDFTSLDSNGKKALQIYFNERVFLISENKNISFNITSLEIIEDGIVLQVKSKAIKPINQTQPFSMQNALFFDVFANQVNSVKYNGVTKRFMLRQAKLILNE